MNFKNCMCIVVGLLLISCRNHSTQPALFPDTTKNIIESVQPENAGLFPGRYGEMSIGIDSNRLSGVYEYYDEWNERNKEYMKISTFYFSGEINKNNSFIDIKAFWPDIDQDLKGGIKISGEGDSVRIGLFLNDMPFGYADVDFTNGNAYVRRLDERKAWKQIRLVKSSRVRLYDAPDPLKPKKAFIVKNDIVKVLSAVRGWYHIEYNPVNNNNKSITAWIRAEELL